MNIKDINFAIDILRHPQSGDESDINFALYTAIDALKAWKEVLEQVESEEYSEIKNEVKDLSKRVETLENQMKEDKEERLKKLKAELDYAKFCCALQEERNKHGTKPYVIG